MFSGSGHAPAGPSLCDWRLDSALGEEVLTVLCDVSQRVFVIPLGESIGIGVTEEVVGLV